MALCPEASSIITGFGILYSMNIVVNFRNVVMTGKELFEKYVAPHDEYSRTLLTACSIEGENVYSLLEEAEQEGKKLVLDYPITDGPSEPMVVLR